MPIVRLRQRHRQSSSSSSWLRRRVVAAALGREAAEGLLAQETEAFSVVLGDADEPGVAFNAPERGLQVGAQFVAVQLALSRVQAETRAGYGAASSTQSRGLHVQWVVLRAQLRRVARQRYAEPLLERRLLFLRKSHAPRVEARVAVVFVERHDVRRGFAQDGHDPRRRVIKGPQVVRNIPEPLRVIQVAAVAVVALALQQTGHLARVRVGSEPNVRLRVLPAPARQVPTRVARVPEPRQHVRAIDRRRQVPVQRLARRLRNVQQVVELRAASGKCAKQQRETLIPHRRFVRRSA
mmetsp:Transcript_1126/g.3244  ORF Transcript_1126/g.3244 Transcript_1126/m.3244 type:complete len:295 (-) Transcript_1126:97-981(-)